jgi:hypothetical protein
LRAVRACSGLGPLLRAKGGKVAVGEKNNKIEGSRADTRVVGGIVYWRGVHTNTHADKEQAGRQARVDRVLRVSRLTVRCVIKYCVAGYAMVTLQGKVNEVITEHEVKKLRRSVYSRRWMIARDFWCQEEGSAQCFRKWFARNAPCPSITITSHADWRGKRATFGCLKAHELRVCCGMRTITTLVY